MFSGKTGCGWQNVSVEKQTALLDQHHDENRASICSLP